MKTHTISYTITAWWLPAIINDDYTGTSAEDDLHIATLLGTAVTDAPEGYRFSHFATTEERDEFGLCTISGLRGNVEVIEAVYVGKSA